jgi:hypothetical protein
MALIVSHNCTGVCHLCFFYQVNDIDNTELPVAAVTALYGAVYQKAATYDFVFACFPPAGFPRL